MKFAQDVVPLTDLKTNPGRVVLVTSRGRGVAVVQSIEEFEAADDERAFMRAVVKGLADLDEGSEVSLTDTKSRLGLD